MRGTGGVNNKYIRSHKSALVNNIGIRTKREMGINFAVRPERVGQEEDVERARSSGSHILFRTSAIPSLLHSMTRL